MNSSFIPAEGSYPPNYMADQRRLLISELQIDNCTTFSTFSCWKTRFKTQVSDCSASPLEAILWIKEVEMVDSVDDFQPSLNSKGIFMYRFEKLDARIASALNKIIQNSYFKKKVSLEEQKAQKEDRFVRGRDR